MGQRPLGPEADWAKGHLSQRLIGPEATWARGLFGLEATWDRVQLCQRQIGLKPLEPEADKTRGRLSQRSIDLRPTGPEVSWARCLIGTERTIGPEAAWT